MALSIDLSNRIALVTGAAGGLGAAMSRDLAAAGADVVLVDIALGATIDALAEEITALGRRAWTFHCDVADPASVRALGRELRAALESPPSILVNNAGHYRDYGAIHAVEDEIIDRTIDTNLKGMLYMSREISSWLLDAGVAGAIVNIASGAGHGGRLRHAHYSASKGGVIAATRGMALDLSPSITVNSVSVGFVDVGRFDEDQLLAVKLDILPRIPLGAGRPADVSAMVCYLASPLARWITGADIRVDGGESAGRVPLPEQS